MPRHLTITADAHIRGVEAAFSSLPGYDVDLRVLENKKINNKAVHDADILLTRSSTRVNADLLAGSSVRFAGTATIGDDHYDKDYLQTHGIAFANAAGSSTGSVIEYMLTALLYLHGRGLINIPESTLGIIGAGRIGSALARRCHAMGMKVLLNDPPRARSEGNDAFVSLDELLGQADILSLHTPLIREGVDKTVHLLDRDRLAHFSGHAIINAARGACLDNRALYEWLDKKAGHVAALDCWEHEPGVSTALLAHPQMAIATPHIAGHSLDGKAANTLFIYRALCDWLDIRPTWNIEEELPADSRPVNIPCADDPFATLLKAAESLYPLHHDHESMKSWAALPAGDLGAVFTDYRRNYPVRRAWEHAPVHLLNADALTRRLAKAIGLKTV
ncbi:MAG: 4-phosphoerythronate dehydrogenase [Mariprofundaceae bacterium]